MIDIELVEGEEQLTQFVQFQDEVYSYRTARWPALVPFLVPFLKGDMPFAKGRRMRPLVAREKGAIVARAVAVVDERYVAHWNEPLGHILMFEALPDTREATKQLMDAACDWLRSEGMEAARAGFGVFEFPFVTDEYEALPPSQVRQNPPYYHSLLKDASFETEKGWVDYKVEVSDQLKMRWQGYLDSAKSAGFEIVPLAEISESVRSKHFTETWNEAFAKHWGATPLLQEENELIFEMLGPMGMMDLSVVGYEGSTPVGVLWVGQEMTWMAATNPDREIADSEKLNFLGIGVLEAAWGRGLNLGMAAYSYLELARRGATHVSYTMVLDDNWPSRRTAEKLGAFVCANYLVYRRNFR